MREVSSRVLAIFFKPFAARKIPLEELVAGTTVTVARLRDRKTDKNLLLLKTQMEAGHGGAPGRFDRLKEVALSYAFGLMMTKGVQALSMTPPARSSEAR